MIRFFVRPEQIQGGRVILDADDAHHLRVVLQATPGDAIAILDGSGREWTACLETVGKNQASASLGPSSEPRTEPWTQITIAQALPKMAEKMEQVLQRGTEIGAAHVRAFASARSLGHLTGERQAKRLARWHAIVKTAAEQSHRTVLPTVQADETFADLLAATSQYDLTLLAHPTDTAKPLREAIAAGPRTILVLVGPESGFSEREIADAAAAGVQIVTLGPRILRTETAAMVMTAQILYALEPLSVR